MSELTRRGTMTAARELVAVKQSVAIAYVKANREVRDMMRKLERKLDEHDRRQAEDPLNWGFVGDYGHVKEELQSLVDFL